MHIKARFTSLDESHSHRLPSVKSLMCLTCTLFFLKRTWESLELERSCAGNPQGTDARRCPGRSRWWPCRRPSSPRPPSARYASVCSVSSPGRICRWSRHCWSLRREKKQPSRFFFFTVRHYVLVSTNGHFMERVAMACSIKNSFP